MIVDGQGSGGMGDYNSPLHAEYPMVRWLEANGYNVSYTTDVDSDRNGDKIIDHKVFMSVGHDEYWSGGQRANVEAARDAGVNLAFFSGNESYWKTRWENSIDASGQPFRTLVCYKESKANAQIDPVDLSQGTWTGTWRDNRFSPPADGGHPENALSGTMYMNDRTSVDLGVPMTVSSADGALRFWRGTTVASLQPGQTATLGQYIVGYETDEDVDNGFRPAGLMDMSSTTFTTTSHVLDQSGTIEGPGTSTHKITLYRAASGALVFGAGTVQWSWGLDGNHNGSSSTPVLDMQQATVNLLADMSNVQPGSLQSQLGLVAASPSTDQSAPTTTITSPINGSSFPVGSPVTITGTASDLGGGVVAGVEVSVDGGVTWHPAVGRGSWSYSWIPSTTGPATIEARATDDSGNYQNPVSIAVSIHSTLVNASIWPAGVPAVAAIPDDANPQELGVKFRSEINGYITGIRFYKGQGNDPLPNNPHIGHLWSSAGGVPLASATFTNETATGWQEVDFATPVGITANTTYVASYYAPQGHYAYTSAYFQNSGAGSGVVYALSNVQAGGNGVFVDVQPPGAFPSETYNATNYWVDVVFNAPSDSAPPVVATTGPVDSANSVTVGSTITATFNEAVQASSINFSLEGPNGTVAATMVYDKSTKTAMLLPLATLAGNTTYTATVSGAMDFAGNVMTPQMQWSFTTGTAPQPTVFNASIWPSNPAPQGTVSEDIDRELGVKFQSDVDGVVTALRFNKPGNDLTQRSVHLWTNSGTLLGTGTLSTSQSGWTTINLAAPVPISANTTYIASYTVPAHALYAYTQPGLTNEVDSGHLRALSSAASAGNGVFGDANTLPTGTFRDTNYWVDVVFGNTIPSASIGDFVWDDSDDFGGDGIQESWEPGIDGAKITLLDANGNALTTTVSHVNPTDPTKHGYYKFIGVPLGSYKLKFELPPQYAITAQHADSDPLFPIDGDPNSPIDSDPIMPNTVPLNVGTTGLITLSVPNADDNNIDCGGATTDIEAGALLTISKTGNGTVNSTDAVTFTITISNTGPLPFPNVLVHDSLPGSTLAWTSDKGTISTLEGGKELNYVIPSLASGATEVIHVSATTPAGYSAILNNVATATALGGTISSNVATDTVLAPHLTITKAGNGTINATDTATFVITVTNTGPGKAYGVNLNDPLPDAAHLNWLIQNGDPGSISAGGILTDAIGMLDAGASVTIHVSALTTAGYNGTLNNTATVSSTNNSPGSLTASATDTVQSPVVLAPSLSVMTTPDSALLLNSTDPVGFTITVMNAAGAGTAYGVNLSDTLPALAGVTWTTASLVSGSAPTPTLSGNSLSDAIGSLPAGASVVIHVSGTTITGFSGTITTTATATPTNGSAASGSGSENFAAPQLAITTTGNGTINSTDAATFTITVTNSGPGKAYGVSLNDPLPDAAHLNWTIQSGPGSISSGTLMNAIGNLAAGASVSIIVSAATPAGYSGTLNNTASATSTNNGPSSVSASATDTVQTPHLTITQTGNGTVSSPGTASFTIVVANTGLGKAYAVNLSDPLPDSAHLTWTTDAGTITSGTLTDAIGNLASGASVTIHVSAAAAAGYSGTLNNTATITSTNNSPGSQSALATDIVIVAPKPTLTLPIAGQTLQVNEGASQSYNLGSFQESGLPAGTHTWTVSVTWGDGASYVFTTSIQGSLGSLNHTYADDGSYPVKVRVTDDSTVHSFDEKAFTVHVNNVAPLINSLTNSSPDVGYAQQGDSVTITALFSDVGTLDTHSASIDWGDGAPAAGVVNEAMGRVTGAHTYAAGGIYNVVLTLTDDNGGQVTMSTTCLIAGAGLHGTELQIIGTNNLDIVFIYTLNGTLTVHTVLGLAWTQSNDCWDSSDTVDTNWSDYLSKYRRLDVPAASVSQLTIRTYSGNDYVFDLSTQNATIDGGAGNDWLVSGPGNDTITDLLGNNVIYSSSGNDVVTTGPGNDVIYTDGGDDRVTDSGGTNTINTGDGNDQVTTGGGNDVIYTGAGNDTVTDAGGNNWIYTDGGNDTITAGAGNDLIYAGAGDDTVNAGAGNDIVVGGDGNDLLSGGDGKDLVIGGNGSDTIQGDGSEDILIAGTTAFDANDAALQSILAEWTSGRSYAQRVYNLSQGTAGSGLDSSKFSSRVNGSYYLIGNDGSSQTVFNDTVVDTLTGGSDAKDWFLANKVADNGGPIDNVNSTDLAMGDMYTDTDF